MLFSQFDASEHAPLVSRVTADTNHRVNEMSQISGNVNLGKNGFNLRTDFTGNIYSNICYRSNPVSG